jgi:hypothetical protein
VTLDYDISISEEARKIHFSWSLITSCITYISREEHFYPDFMPKHIHTAGRGDMQFSSIDSAVRAFVLAGFGVETFYEVRSHLFHKVHSLASTRKLN